jgi:nucleotide-binding universal stress UspA family protein
MLAMRTILHPTDFSEQSTLAFGLACALARDHGARVVVVHVFHVPVAVYTEGGVPPAPSDREKEDLREELIRQHAAPNVEIVHRFVEGTPVAEILQTARAEAADLIVMGTHGRRGLSRFFMGSVAEQVMRQATCPVLTVKTPLETRAGHLMAGEVATSNA